METCMSNQFEAVHVWLDSNGFFWGSQHPEFNFLPDFSIVVAPWSTTFDIIQEIKNVCLYSKKIREIYEPLIISQKGKKMKIKVNEENWIEIKRGEKGSYIITNENITDRGGYPMRDSIDLVVDVEEVKSQGIVVLDTDGDYYQCFDCSQEIKYKSLYLYLGQGEGTFTFSGNLNAKEKIKLIKELFEKIGLQAACPGDI